MSEFFSRKNVEIHSLWKGRRPSLSHIDVELTERCTNDCRHCYIRRPVDDPESRKRESSAAKIVDILKQAADLGCLSVRLTGGEPLLRPDFEEIYFTSRKLGLKVTVFTNAALITPAVADLWSRIPPLTPVEVTLYGTTRKVCEAVTRMPGSFEAAMSGIHLLRENDIPFVLKGAWLPASRGDLDALDALSRTVPWMDGPPSVSIHHMLHARRDPARNRLIRRQRPDPIEGIVVQARHPDEYLRGMKEFLSTYSRPSGELLFDCGAGTGSCALDAFGVLQPCLLVRHPDVVFDIGKGSLEEALNRFFPEVRKMKAENPAYLERCARCHLHGFCEQCPGKSWMENGTLDTPVEYFCRVAHLQAEVLGLLESGERAWEIEDWKKRLECFSEADVKRRLAALAVTKASVKNIEA